MSFIKSSEIGKRSVVLYRAKILGIEPIEYSYRDAQYLYSVNDAERILGYKPNQDRAHSMAYFPILKTIMESEENGYDFAFLSKRFKISSYKLKIILDEYKNSGCFITPSKMNNKLIDL